MRGLAAAALAVAIALPSCAQHGGAGHAGFGGHSGPGVTTTPGFHGGIAPSHGGFSPSHSSFNAPEPMHYSGGTLPHQPVSYPSSMRLIAPGVRYPASAPVIRPTFYHPPHGVTITRNFYIHTYPVYPYAYPYYAYPTYVYGYLPADMLDDAFKSNYDSSQQPPPQPEPDNGSAYSEPVPQPEYGYPQPAPQPEYAYPQPIPQGAYAYPQPQPEGAYAVPPGYQAYVPQPQPQPVAPQMQYAPGSASTVILIYKDGRPPEEIQNYLATRSTLTVLDGGRRREIPLSDLNIPATVSANRQTGVEFNLPGMTH